MDNCQLSRRNSDLHSLGPENDLKEKGLHEYFVKSSLGYQVCSSFVYFFKG